MIGLFYPFLTCSEYFAFPIYPSLDQPHLRHSLANLASGCYMEKSTALERQVSLQLDSPIWQVGISQASQVSESIKGEMQGCKNRCRIRDFVSQGTFT